VGAKVWAITPDGDKFEAIIAHPQDENEEWGCQVKIGATDEFFLDILIYVGFSALPLPLGCSVLLFCSRSCR